MNKNFDKRFTKKKQLMNHFTALTFIVEKLTIDCPSTKCDKAVGDRA